eukprot:TRINITY_DN2672_c0_g7_i1.p1 TRINITY_DN2672_c0_g7~~TRINITY_DN2672_c0_g7_i1.p1  ORF type:complete len:540 (+),score=113.53 TRINITY_DN2672_c0_g7_i1:1463-3082(+)
MRIVVHHSVATYLLRRTALPLILPLKNRPLFIHSNGFGVRFFSNQRKFEDDNNNQQQTPKEDKGSLNEDLREIAKSRRRAKKEEKSKLEVHLKHALGSKPEPKEGLVLRSSLYVELMTAVVWVFISMLLAAYFTGQDDTELYLEKIDKKMAQLQELSKLTHKEEKKKDFDRLIESLVRHTQTNDSLRKLIVEKGYFGIFVNLIKADLDANSINYSAKILDHLSQLPSNKPLIINDESMKSIISIVNDVESPLFIRKTMGVVLSNLAVPVTNIFSGDSKVNGPEFDQVRVRLAELGVVGILTNLNQDKKLRRKLFGTAIRYISKSCLKVNEKGELLSVSSSIPNNDLIVLQQSFKQSAEEEQWALIRYKNAFVNSGLAMYLHTSLGGALWGAFESMRIMRKDTKIPINWKLVLRSALRTSLVTGLVPIYFVGIGVSLYNYANHRIDTNEQRFYFSLATFVSLYPWYYLLPIVERFSPFWIGGHIVGFMSFFTYMYITENDMFKVDNQLIYEDAMNKRRKEQEKKEKEKALLAPSNNKSPA